MKNIFITGSNRGIGLELTRQYLQRGERVFASCRDPEAASQLKELSESYPQHLFIIQLDVTDRASIEAAVVAVTMHNDSLDVLFNNAGMAQSGERLDNIDAETLVNVLHTNAIGPMIVAQKFLELLKQGQSPKIINVSSQLGSIARKRSGGRYSYDGSKAALNMFTRTLAFEVLPEGIITIVMHPGWVQTDMGGSNAHLKVEDSARGILAVIDKLSKQDAGRFLQWDGEELPW